LFEDLAIDGASYVLFEKKKKKKKKQSIFGIEKFVEFFEWLKS
jgi:hypothetical protein